MLKPIEVVTAPITDSDDHVSHICAHIGKVVAAVRLGHGDALATLRQCGRVARERAPTLMEHLLHVEFLIGVNPCGGARSVRPAWLLQNDISGALAITVAGREAVSIIRALMCGSSERILVCLHDIELGTAMATHIGTIAVLEGVVVVQRSWHYYSIECGQAAAVTPVEIDIELNRTAQQIRLEVG